MNGRLVSLKTIVERVYSDYGFNYSLSLSDAAEWAGSLLTLFKAPISLETKVGYVDIIDYKGKLPCDLESIISCAYVDGSIGNGNVPNSVYVFQGQGSYLADTTIIDPINRDAVIHLSYSENSNQLWGQTNNLIPMRYSTDSFQNKYHHCDWDITNTSNITYKVNSNYIFPNFTKGKVAIAYLAIPLDEDGYPLIPADEKWQGAVRSEIAWKIAMKLFIQSNITDKVYELIERERNWAVAKVEVPDFTIDMLESFKNSWVRLIPKPFEHNNFFRNAQFPETRFNHPITYGR